MKYFINCKTIEECKALFKKLAKVNHPDVGGDAEIMKEINAEYERACQTCFTASAKSFQQAKKTSFDLAPFMSILSKILHLDIKIEIIGCWIYCFDSYNEHEYLKSLGFWYSAKHRAWVFSGMKKRGFMRTRMTTDDIRNSYGSVDVETAPAEKLAR